ncbi:hypothetical protein CF386_04045 [Paraphotobacterium marinum]|uniref:carbonic anhydrase n=1 Tax=Paraphotobacterium marinum TaxID=1755811 RepID=A0A220VEA2_9GAMM|nr:carbonic anhydrase family protein [Paraphotobacterium marinum]ASK78253.1 hypothetical protein CF386_04045 [Paraphotobacterium marinum]
MYARAIALLLTLILSVSSFTVICKELNKSPINITANNVIRANLKALDINLSGAVSKVSLGKDVMVAYAKGNNSLIDGSLYNLSQIDFFSPSLHEVSGKKFPLEAQLIFVSKNNKVKIVSILYQTGVYSNNFLSKLINFKNSSDKNNNLSLPIKQILPEGGDYMTYNGSLVTPPFSSGIRWYIMKSLSTITKSQLNKIKSLIRPNNRKIQPLNARFILSNS